MAPRKVTVRVPATAANLGPAFDCMGLALGLYSTVTLERAERFSIDVTGQGAGQVSRGEDNLTYRAVGILYQHLGRRPPPLRLRCRNAIPLARGLGSSAAAVVGGLVAAGALEGASVSKAALLRLATALEGHPDNVAPALLGGCQVVVTGYSSTEGCDELVTAAVPVKRGLRAVAFVPEMELSTKDARGVLPPSVSRADAVHNVGRAALLVVALAQGRWDLLGVATEDRLHQPPRRALFPAMEDLFRAARSAGAHGVFLSGAGSTVLALVTGDPEPVGRAMAEAGARAGVPGSWRALAVGVRGARVVRAE